MSFGHISIPTGPARFKAMRDFYQKSLAPLGFTVYAESTENEQPLAGGTAAGENGIRYLGLQTRDGKPEFWLHAGTKDVEPVTYDESRPHIEMEGRGLHLAWMVDSDEIVDEWYRVALLVLPYLLCFPPLNLVLAV